MEPTRKPYQNPVHLSDQAAIHSGRSTKHHEPQRVIVDPHLQEPFNEGKIREDGELRLENLSLPSNTPLQPDAIKHIEQFLLIPFWIDGILTEAIRQELRDILAKRKHEPEVHAFLHQPFMQTTQSISFGTYVQPGMMFLQILNATGGKIFDWIGSSSRIALRTTMIKMVETVLQKPCVLSPHKEKEFRTGPNDFDFVIPVEYAPYEYLMTLTDIVPNIVTYKIFGRCSPVTYELLNCMIRKIMFKTPQLFGVQYDTGVSFGNPHKKIDITFIPRSHHNHIFEFQKLGITIHRKMLDTMQFGKPTLPDGITLNTSLCIPDHGYQAAFDYIHDIVRSKMSHEVNEKGFAAWILWISKGFNGYHIKTLLDFHDRLSNYPTLGDEIGRQLALSYESHHMGNKWLLIANYLNTFSVLGLIYHDKTEEVFKTVSSHLHRILTFPSSGIDKFNTFEVLLSAYRHNRLQPRLYLNWLTICLTLAQSQERISVGKKALQLKDECALLLFSDFLTALNHVIDNYSAACASDFKDLFNRHAAWADLKTTLCPLEQLNQFKTLAIRYLDHADMTMRRIGLRLYLSTLEHSLQVNAELFLGMPAILNEEQGDVPSRLLRFMESCYVRSHHHSSICNVIGELELSLSKTKIVDVIQHQWTFTLLRSRVPSLIDLGLLKWKELKEEDKFKERAAYIQAVVHSHPAEALTAYVSYEIAPTCEALGKIVSRLKHSKIPASSAHLEKALTKALNAHESQRVPGKLQKKRTPPYADDFFWIYTKIAPAFPENASMLIQRLHNEGCIDLGALNVVAGIFELGMQLPVLEYLKIWSWAEKNGCPLLTTKSAKKNTCLVRICEELANAKSPELETFLHHAITQELDSDQKKQIQTLIQQIATIDHPLKKHLTKEQVSQMALADVNRVFAQRHYMDASKKIDKIWDQVTPEVQKGLLGIDLAVTKWVLNEISTSHENEKKKRIITLSSHIDFKLNLIEKAKSDQLTRDLVESWVQYIMNYLDCLSDGRSLPPKFVERLKSIVGTITRAMKDKKANTLACQLLKKISLVPVDIRPTESLMDDLGVITSEIDDVELFEQLMSSLKFYRQPDVASKRQLEIYVRLIDRLLERKSVLATVWIDRLLSFCTPTNPLSGKTLTKWVDTLISEKKMELFSRMYKCLPNFIFESESDQQAIIVRWASEGTCPYFAAQLISDNHSGAFSGLPYVGYQNILTRVLQAWVELPAFECTENILHVIKLFTRPLPQLWSKIINGVAKAPVASIKQESYFIFELAEARGLFDTDTQSRASAFISGLHGPIGTQPSLYKNLLGLDKIRNFLEDATSEQREEAYFIIFGENLNTLKSRKDLTGDRLYTMSLLAKRNYLSELKPWNRIDRLIYGELAKLGDHFLTHALSNIQKNVNENPNLNMDEIIHLMLQSMTLDKTNVLILSAFLFQFIGRVNVVPLLKLGVTTSSREILLSLIPLLDALMKGEPQEEVSRIVSAIVIKIVNLPQLAASQLKPLVMPSAQRWLSPNILERCQEIYVVNALYENVQKEDFPNFDEFITNARWVKTRRARELCLDYGLTVLRRMFQKNMMDQSFDEKLLKFFRGLLRYDGPNPVIRARDPRDLPRTRLRGAVCQTKEELIESLEKNALKKETNTESEFHKSEMPVYSFPTANAFFEFALEIFKRNDGDHKPEFDIHDCDISELPQMFREYPQQHLYCPRVIEELETIQYHFSNKEDRDFYVHAITELTRVFSDVRTLNTRTRSGFITFNAMNLIFLIEHYSEYSDKILQTLNYFVFAVSAVDYQDPTTPPLRGQEGADYQIFDRHNAWCNEIITLLTETIFPTDNTSKSLYECMLMIYPAEVYVTNLSFDEQLEVIFNTVNKLKATGSSLHLARAIEILQNLQNLVIGDSDRLASCYQELIKAVKCDPNYIVRDKCLIKFGPPENTKNCTYVSKRPLFLMLNEALNKNKDLFQTFPTKTKMSRDIVHRVNVANQLACSMIEALFEFLEKPRLSNRNFEVLDVILHDLSDFGGKYCFINDANSYCAFLVRAKPHVVKRISMAPNKLEALRRFNLPLLFTVGVDKSKINKPQWCELLNKTIEDLMKVGDQPLNKYLVDWIKTDLLKSDLYDGCTEQLVELKRMCKHS